jgi:hypothetical protein
MGGLRDELMELLTLPGLDPYAVIVVACMWEALYRILSIAIILVESIFPRSLILAGGDRVRLTQCGGSYAVALVHAVVMTCRSGAHLYDLRSAPPAVQFSTLNNLELSADAWAETAQGVERTNLLFAAWLLYDLAHVLWSYPSLGGVDMVAHHLGFLGASAVCGTHRILPFPFAWLLFGEISSIPLNLRFFFIATGRSDSRAMRATNTTFALLFLLARVVLYGWGLYHLFVHREAVLALAAPQASYGGAIIARPLLLLVLSLLGCGYILNLSWFDKVVKMARGIKVMRKKPKRA